MRPQYELGVLDMRVSGCHGLHPGKLVAPSWQLLAELYLSLLGGAALAAGISKQSS